MPVVALLLFALFSQVAAAVEAIGTVVDVEDGDSLIVNLDGKNEKVRLLWVDAAESSDNPHGAAMREGIEATEFTRRCAPVGVRVILSDRGDVFRRDRYGRLLAVASTSRCTPSIQEKLIASGMSVYWRKYGTAPAELHQVFVAAEFAAEQRRAGAWGSSPAWMTNKRREAGRGGNVYDETDEGLDALAAARKSESSKKSTKNSSPVNDVSSGEFNSEFNAYGDGGGRTTPLIPMAGGAAGPVKAENGDVYGRDNDGDGRVETLFRRGTWVHRGDGSVHWRRSGYAADSSD